MKNDSGEALRPRAHSRVTSRTLARAACVCIGTAGAARAQVTETVILDCDGTNCYGPSAPLLADLTGRSGALRGLYGTDSVRVYKLTSPKEGQTAWKDATLRTFQQHTTQPYELGYGALFSFTDRITSDTALYGTSEVGGKTKDSCESGYGYTGCGTVFSLTGHKATKIWDFTGGSDGGQPYFAVVGDKTGALYTSTTYGGGSSSCGTVVKLTPPAQSKTVWAETTLWTFTNGNDGCLPTGLIIDKAGAIYGEALDGGATGDGAVFKLIPPEIGQSAWTEQTLWDFRGGSDGSEPYGPLTAGKDGVLYGTTTEGGSTGNGTVFSLTPPAKGQTAWAEQILWSFTGGADGGVPYAALIVDKAGALYGTTFQDGASNDCTQFGGSGSGTVFRLAPPADGTSAWTETTLWTFSGAGDGGNPGAPLTADNSGVLYGTATGGGSIGAGVVFSLTGTGFVP